MLILPYSDEWPREKVLSPLITKPLLELILRYVTMYGLNFWKQNKEKSIVPVGQGFPGQLNKINQILLNQPTNHPQM